MSLLSNCSSGGCGAKIGPDELTQYLSALPVAYDPNLLIGFESSDDAAVYQVSTDIAMVSTVDFFPPMVDDPVLFGRIAAANALSDIYAMGAKALYALNLVCFPQKMDKAVLADILLGGAEKVKEAGASLCGGHSIYDHEPKYGLAVTGIVQPDKVLRNDGCRPGDCLILTKPLGVGLTLAASTAGEVNSADYQLAIDFMCRLNKYSAEKMSSFAVNACTDITGFGFLVHAAEMAGDEHSLVINFDSLPVLPGAVEYAKKYMATAAGQRNRNYISQKIDLGNIDPAREEILFDPQTSGGLLISVPQEQAKDLCALIQQDDPVASIVGQVTAKDEYSVIIL